MSSRCRPWLMALLVGIATSLLISCGQNQNTAKPIVSAQQTKPATLIPLPTITITISPMPTKIIPTPTLEPPLAARVNGRIISLEFYDKELERYKAAQESLDREIIDGNADNQLVLDALIEQVLIEQAAEAEGISVSDEAINTEIERLIQTTGNQQNFQKWLDTNQYSLEEFRMMLRSQMVAQAMNMLIIAQVPEIMEQVHARHIVVENIETANFILAQLELGIDFATLASEYSLDESTRMNGGDLNFFPRDLILSPQVEDAVFSAKEGEICGPVESDFGFHILEVVEKDPARPLPPEILQRLREVAFDRWIKELWSTAEVERNI